MTACFQTEITHLEVDEGDMLLLPSHGTFTFTNPENPENHTYRVLVDSGPDTFECFDRQYYRYVLETEQILYLRFKIGVPGRLFRYLE